MSASARLEAGTVRLDHAPGDVAVLTLDRPPLNILDRTALAEMARALASLDGDDSVRVVVLRGAGRAFCAGIDVADHTPDRTEPMIRLFHEVVERLLGLEAPVVAALNGAALGGGCELALACDVVLARAGAKIGQPEIRLGVFPPAAAALLPRRVGPQRALDLILTGRAVDADEAAAMGLVTRVLSAEDFDAELDAYVAGLAALSRPVLRLAKRAVVTGLDQTSTGALRGAEHLYLRDLQSLGDAREGIAAFMEKRPPVWSDA